MQKYVYDVCKKIKIKSFFFKSDPCGDYDFMPKIKLFCIQKWNTPKKKKHQ